MNFDVVLSLLVLFCFSGTFSSITTPTCNGLDAFTAIDTVCYWCIGKANMGVGEKTCEQDSGTVFSSESLDGVMMIKEQLNMSSSTEVFIGAMFNDVNGTQDYDWLSAPGNYSELLSNVSSLGIGNKSLACLSVTEEIRAVDCDNEMPETICMREITAHCSCTATQHKNYSSKDLPSMTTNILKSNSAKSTTTLHNHSNESSTPRLLLTIDRKDGMVTQLQTNAVQSDGVTLSQKIVDTNATTDLVASTTISFSSHANNFTTKLTTGLSNLGTLQPELSTKGNYPTATLASDGRKMGETEKFKKTAIPDANDDSSKTPQLNNSHIGDNDSNSAKVNYSQTVDHVPGTNGSIKFGSLIDKIFEKVKINANRNRSTSTIKVTTDTVQETSEMPIIRHCDSEVGGYETLKGQCITTTQSSGGKANIDFANKVKEVQFQVKVQVSPDINMIPPWRGDPDLIPFGENQGIFDILLNTSSQLAELQETTEVTNTTFQTLAETIENVVTHGRIQYASDKIKVALLDDIMATAERLVTQVLFPCENLYMMSERMEVESKLINVDIDNNESYIPIRETKRQSVKLSKTIFKVDKDTRVSTIEYKNLDAIMTSTDSDIGSNILSVSIQQIVGNITKTVGIRDTQGAIILVLKTSIHPDKKEHSRICTFWDFESRNWSSSGCELLDQNATHTTCSCDHLTNFAVLVMYMDDDKISVQSQQVLLTLTTVGCSISIACLAMTLIAFAYLRMLSNEKILIHFNLSLALVLAQIVFVSSSDAHSNPIACKVVAILLHFFFMASFTWMLVEGVALYLLCTKGFMNHRDMRIKYFLLGWGTPIVIVLVSLAAKFPDYGHGPQYSCWLSVQDGLIWAFLGPMLAIVVLNMFVMGLVVRKFLTLKAVAQKTEVAKLRGSLRAMMTLLPLLGLTWLLSLLVPFSVVFHYFFVIINTLQGMCIFFLHCICNDELRRKFKAKRRRWSSPTGSDSDTRYTARKKTGSYGDSAIAMSRSSEYAARKYAWTEESISNLADIDHHHDFESFCHHRENPLFD